ncbi:cytochrome c3 family protein [Desulfurivibrio dismutans]|uniref:cytochrome c3 family protein n=1 Tax=Desulfurivibrio dismutans TaxID=1398908 RepID=UPI0023DA7BD8|nr:cytochrome c3 family protein [Desulfurivibrio alkaliphilus]MDF1613742.1 cytochrome c3 family protein [Desulfurivibrio alkaliphilus]
MFNVRSFAAALLVAGSLVAGGFLVATTTGTAAMPSLAPIADDQAVSAHAPYLTGQCGMCHDASEPDGKSPGKIADDVGALCATCHYDMDQEIKGSSVVHAPAMMSCTACHNPHNSPAPSLLVEEPKNLCLGCHGEIQQTITEAAVQHDAVIDEMACLNCHNPHASDIQHLLTKLPFDLCISCHSHDKPGADGRVRTNFATLLEENPYHHGPVEGKDCSACHLTHGGEHQSLLVDAFPERFYAPYERDNYALCFRCHNEENMLDPETTTTTRFRDGSRNLHYVHVNKPDRGRTCRACHEVHASENPHQVRDAVPFGPRNWMLPINYTKTDTGGSCARTCHQTLSYDNTKE